MTNTELNAILYYADFLSLLHESHPVTDNCKYFFVHGYPINSAYIVDLEPEFDQDNLYLLLAILEFQAILEKYDEDAAMSFIDDICCIKSCGSVDAERMLKCIHLFSTKYERKMAFNAYNQWLKQQAYNHITFNEDGKPIETSCSRYVKHSETNLKKRKLLTSPEENYHSLQKRS